MKKMAFWGITLCLLAACGASPQESCASYGLTPGTDAYAQCIGAEVRNNSNNRRQAMRDFNAANIARGGSIGNYCPIGLTC